MSSLSTTPASLSQAMCPILMLDAPAQGNHPDFVGLTTFQKMVADRDHARVKQALMFIPPDVLNAKANSTSGLQNCTPLSISCAKGDLRMVRLLTLAGADVTIPAQGKVPGSVGEESIHPIASCLLSALSNKKSD